MEQAEADAHAPAFRSKINAVDQVRCVAGYMRQHSIEFNIVGASVANIFFSPHRKERSSHHRPYPLPVAIRRANPPRWWRWTPLHSTLSSPRHICEQKLSLINKSSDISPEQNNNNSFLRVHRASPRGLRQQSFHPHDTC